MAADQGGPLINWDMLHVVQPTVREMFEWAELFQQATYPSVRGFLGPKLSKLTSESLSSAEERKGHSGHWITSFQFQSGQCLLAKRKESDDGGMLKPSRK